MNRAGKDEKVDAVVARNNTQPGLNLTYVGTTTADAGDKYAASLVEEPATRIRPVPSPATRLWRVTRHIGAKIILYHARLRALVGRARHGMP